MRNVFKIKREERPVALVALLAFTLLNALQIYSHFGEYIKAHHVGFYTVSVKVFRLSGYDSWSCVFLSNGQVYFESERHPLYLTLLYPFRWLNEWIMGTWNVNAAWFIMAVLIVAAATYAAVFMFRTLHEVMGLSHFDSCLLTLMLFSVAHVMVPAICPDHFIFSLMLLTMTLYICGCAMLRGRELKVWQSFLLLFFTSGMALSNGIKTIIADIFTNRRHFFRPVFLIVGVVLPLLLLLGIRQLQYQTIEVPRIAKRTAIDQKRVRDNIHDEKFRNKLKHNREWHDTHNGKALGKGLISKYIDVSTPRGKSIVENLLGESFQLHRDQLLKDVQQDRSMFVSYHHWWSYAAEILIVLLIIAGSVAGIRFKLMQMVLCWTSIDFILNIVLGFAINEVYIMTSGWAFLLPISIGFLLLRTSDAWRSRIRIIAAGLTFFLLIRNGGLLTGHLLGLC